MLRSSVDYLDQCTPHDFSVQYTRYSFDIESNTIAIFCATFEWQPLVFLKKTSGLTHVYTQTRQVCSSSANRMFLVPIKKTKS